MTYVYSTYSGMFGQNGIVWSVTNGTGSATINSSTGVLTGVSAGTVTVKATYNYTSVTQWSSSCTVYIIPLADGVYFINNRERGGYIQLDDDASDDYSASGVIIEQHQFDGEDYQRWELKSLGNGYYHIISVESNRALAVPTGAESSAGVTLIQEVKSSSNYRQQWEFIATSNGAYKIRARSAPSNLVICVNWGVSDLLHIKQNDYVNDDVYFDEWYLCRLNGSEAMLMGILVEDHDHTTALGNIMPHILNQGYKDFNCIVTDNISRSDVQDAMESARIYVSRSHGNTDSNGAYILLSEDNTSWIHSDDIYNFANDISVIDLSQCDLMLFVACYTGTNENISLPHAAVKAGAKYAIGFKDSIDCDTANSWTEYFFQYYTKGYSVESSARYAARDCLNLNNIDSYRVVPE